MVSLVEKGLPQVMFELTIFSTMELHGRPYVGLLSLQDNIQALTPLELSYEELNPTPAQQYDRWHGSNRSYIPGLN